MDMEIDHEITDEIVCPECGYEFTESYEYNPTGEYIGLIECGSCDKSFYARRYIKVTYDTRKATYGNCRACGAENVVVENQTSSLVSFESLCMSCGEKVNDNARMEQCEKIKRRHEQS